MAVALALLPFSAAGHEPAQSDSALLVLAASSLVDVLPRALEGWVAAGNPRPNVSFDATSRLARQALQHPEASVLVSADLDWIRWLEAEGGVAVGAARQIAGNRLVLVVPATAAAADPTTDGLGALSGLTRLALAGENVPAGRYARSALEARGLWDPLAERVVRGGSVRATLEWVARGDVPAGIVYRTDALAEPRVRVAFLFEPADHPPIGYYAVPLAAAPNTLAARALTDFLASSDAASVFASAGFSTSTELSGATPAAEAAAQRSEPGALPSIASAIRLSVVVALIATLLGLVPAVALGWLLARRDFTGKSLVSTLVLAPLVVPPVVTGFLLLSAFGSNTPVGAFLANLGVTVPFTLIGASLAAFVVGFPLYVISVRGAFEAVDPFYEQLSWTLGSPPRRTFFRISLPLALPGIAAGAVLAFARALGEFGATVVLAGNVEGTTRTISLAVYTLLEAPAGRSAIWLLIGASVGISLAALLGFEALMRRQRARLEDRHVR